MRRCRRVLVFVVVSRSVLTEDAGVCFTRLPLASLKEQLSALFNRS
jgi:hypothetical protein